MQQSPDNGRSNANRSVVLVTGSSSGIGRACSDHLTANGHTVYGGSRSGTSGSGWTHISLDVTDDASVNDAISQIEAEHGRIDALVHCAGISIAGALEDITIDEARRQFDTNYFGAIRTTRAVLPAMRKRRTGKVIIIGSIGGLIGLPFIGHYSASKFALDGFMQALRTELLPFGVQATVVHPGDIRTAIAQNQIMASAADASSDYAGLCTRTVNLYTDSVSKAPEPIIVAQLIERLMARKKLAPNYLVGSSLEKVAVGLKAWLPASSFEFIFRKAYGL